MGNAVVKKTTRVSQARLKSVEIYADSKKSEGALYSKETFTKGQFILDKCHFIAIYDGHGYYGGSAAYEANESLMAYFENNRSILSDLSTEKDIKTFILDGFRQIQKKLSEESIYRMSGTCCIGALILESKLYTINLGNSKAVLCTSTATGPKAVELSRDQTLTSAEERDRISRQGLKIHKVKEQGKEYGAERLWTSEEGLGITVTRALGDWQVSKAVLSDPEIEEYDLSASDKFVLLGSDGLWDVISPEEAVKILNEKKRGKEGVDELLNQAKKRWRDRIQKDKYTIGDEPSSQGKTDDITVNVCYFNFPSAEEMETLDRFNFLYDNKQARLKGLKDTVTK